MVSLAKATKKFIIIEGIDNVGKSTLIRNIRSKSPKTSYSVLDYSNVKGLSVDETVIYSNSLYRGMFEIMDNMYFSDLPVGIICDRSHLGEMVYGNIYRGYPGTYVLNIEDDFKDEPFWEELVLITLVDDAENVISRDDGLSFSTDIEGKNEEISLFKLAHETSNIEHKLLVNVKDYNEEQLTELVMNFIKTDE